MLARYLQHTAFTCTAMEAEFQVAYGRKVRYDCQLGRVRALWDYALKGAKTQAEKRKRGEYNRPVAVEKKNGVGTSIVPTTKENEGSVAGDTTKKGGKEDRPGAGNSLDWLAGRTGTGDVNTTGSDRAESAAQGGDEGGKDRRQTRAVSRRVDALDGLVSNNAMEQADVDEPAKKRAKKEHEDGSGSEYMDSSDDE